jgi:hypothetical protein
MANDVKAFHGKMNQDVAVRFIPEGDYYDALNIAVSNNKDGKSGSITNMIASESLFNAAIGQNGSDVCLGIFSDTRNDVIYYFQYDASSVHGIYKYDPYSDAWTAIIEDSALNFSATKPILTFGATEDYIFFTDGYNPPRVIDLNFNYSTPATLDETYFNIAKVMPMYAPKVKSVSDRGYTPDNVIGKFFQFKFRYVFTNNQRSTFSPISGISYSSDDFTQLKELEQREYKYNAIDVTINGRNSNDMVESIEIAARQGNLGDFYIIDKVDVDASWRSNGDLVYRFYNSGLYETIAIKESNQIFDDVPRTCKSLIFGHNRLFMANNLMGYDKPVPSYTITPIYEDMVDTGASAYSGTATRTDMSSGANFSTFLTGIGYTPSVGDVMRVSGIGGYTPSSINITPYTYYDTIDTNTIPIGTHVGFVSI